MSLFSFLLEPLPSHRSVLQVQDMIRIKDVRARLAERGMVTAAMWAKAAGKSSPKCLKRSLRVGTSARQTLGEFCFCRPAICSCFLSMLLFCIRFFVLLCFYFLFYSVLFCIILFYFISFHFVFCFFLSVCLMLRLRSRIIRWYGESDREAAGQRPTHLCHGMQFFAVMVTCCIYPVM